MAISYISSHQLSWKELLFPWRMIKRFAANRSLLKQFTWREVEKRYKGTALGLLWSLLTPLLMLAVYTIVFGFIFGGSFGHPGETRTQFALGLFCGLLLWDLIATAITASPLLIVNNSNFVTKVIFPLEILPVAMIASLLVHMAIGFVPLLLFILLSQGVIHLTALSFFLLLIPVLFYTLGISWVLSAIGVFLRDVGAMMPAVITVLMFMSAIFFPPTVIPEAWRWVLMLNPAAVLISMARNAVVFNQWPDFYLYGIELVVSIVVATIGYAFFMKVKSAFADVL